jgi:hypothetical protein
VAADFADSFAALRGMLRTQARTLLVTADTPTDFMMALPTKKNRVGEGCFNFTAVDRARLNQLSTLTRKGIAAFKNLPLPWDKPSKE